jgi:hypothetical protein
MEADLCREVSLRRSEDGSLGISIKGGREHNLPILISRLSSTDEAARYFSCTVLHYSPTQGEVEANTYS